MDHAMFFKTAYCCNNSYIYMCVCVCVTVKELHNGRTFLHPCKMVKLKMMI